MRRIASVAALLILSVVVAACSERGAPQPASPTLAATVTKETVGVHEGTTTLAPQDTEPTAASRAVLATAMAVATAPAPAISSPISATTGLPLPALLAEVDLGEPAGNSYAPRSLAVHPRLGRLYVRTQGRAVGGGSGSALVTVIDLETYQIVDVVPVGSEPGYADWDTGQLVVDPSHDLVYALNPGQTSCTVLDALTLQEVATLKGVDALALGTGDQRVVVAGVSRVRAYEPAGRELLGESEPLMMGKALALFPDLAGDRLALLHRQGPSYALHFIAQSTLAPVGEVSLPGRVAGMVYDPAGNRFYVTANDDDHNILWILDGEGNRLREEVLGDWTQTTYLALDPAGRRLFMARDVYRDNGIAVIDLDSGRTLMDIPVVQSLQTAAWHPEADLLLVSHTYSNQVSFVDLDRGRDVATVHTARDLIDLAVDEERGRLYASDTAGQVRVLDSLSGKELARLDAKGHIAVDSAHGRLYVGGAGADRVRVIDADSLQLAGEILTKARPVADAYHGDLYLVRSGVYLASLETMTVTQAITGTLPGHEGYSPNPAAVNAVVDPGSGRLFAIINNGVPGSNNGNYLHIYEPETYQRVLTDTERSPIYVDVDPTTGRAYISRTHLVGRSTVLWAEGNDYEARLDAVYGALRVDPGLGRVFLSVSNPQDGYLLILDAQNLDVLDSVMLDGGFELAALDTVRHRLYLSRGDGKVQIWSAMGGERPEPPAALASGQLPADEPLLYLTVTGGGALYAGSLYRSDDEGVSWQALGTGMPSRGVYDIVSSPDFAVDETLFGLLVATDEGFGVWKSVDGGLTWHISSAGLLDFAVQDLVISPAFGRDQTLFASARKQGVFRSTDGGLSWQALSDRYRRENRYGSASGLVAISPTYDRDGTVYVSDDGLFRSLDRGDHWTQVLTQSVGSLALSPAFAGDGHLFAWTGRGELLFSDDRGDTWQDIDTGLNLEAYGWGQVLVTADYVMTRQFFFIWRPSDWDEPPQFFRGMVGGKGSEPVSWQRLTSATPLGRTPVILAPDGSAFLALDDGGMLVRWSMDTLAWGPVEGQPVSQPTIVADKGPTPTVGAHVPDCALEPAEFLDIWTLFVGQLGCPAAAAERVLLAEQALERGRMIWDSAGKQIYVLLESGQWQVFDDTFESSKDPEYDAALPPPPEQPQRGFGKVWREQLGGPQASIGWAVENERSVDGWRQRFAKAWLFWTDSPVDSPGLGTAYLLFDDGTWRSAAAPRP